MQGSRARGEPGGVTRSIGKEDRWWYGRWWNTLTGGFCEAGRSDGMLNARLATGRN